jgi:hypothetical protein
MLGSADQTAKTQSNVSALAARMNHTPDRASLPGTEIAAVLDL